MADLREIEKARCHAGKDGDCYWPDCPQEANGRANYQPKCPLICNHEDEENTNG